VKLISSFRNSGSLRRSAQALINGRVIYELECQLSIIIAVMILAQ